MWVQPFQPAPTERVPPALHADRLVAVLLNANARRVTPKVVRALSHVVPKKDLYLSRSPLDARRIAQQVMAKGYHTVFLGGGDGTVMCFMNEVLDEASRRGLRAPHFGVLKLGTGNSVASMVSASAPNNDGLSLDVLRARAPFAGMGVDGRLLNDYIWVKENLGQGPFSRLLSGPGGYFTSVAFRTVPYYLTHATAMNCEVVNGNGPAYRLDASGAPVGAAIKPGEVLFRGPVNLCAAGTVPYYGYELRTFPFAGKRRGMMHLRLANLSAAKALANLPKMWAGTWFPREVLDFHAADVRVSFEKPMPLQVAGDALGERQNLRIGIAKESVELADFNGLVH
jgi:diacylglycerol kinase family enzyme